MLCHSTEWAKGYIAPEILLYKYKIKIIKFFNRLLLFI